MKHFSEAELLETYYLQPGESMPVMLHLAGCADCAARYERLDRKLREAASCETVKHDTFWTRQRMSIQRRIGERRSRLAAAGRITRVAAAAVLAFAIGGAVMYKAVSPALEPPITQTHAALHAPVPADPARTAAAQPAENAIEHDPWQSEELRDFHSVVEWESWMADGDKL